MNIVNSCRSKLLVAIILSVFAIGLAIFALGFVYLTACGCGPVPEVPPPASQVSKR
jgi:hypothetical protein